MTIVSTKTDTFTAITQPAGEIGKARLGALGHRVAHRYGMSEWKDGKTLDETLDAADQHMYAQKHSQATGFTNVGILQPAQS